MLSVTKVDLEVISNAKTYLFFKKGKRGGVSYISKRYSKDTNKFLKSYEPKKELIHIKYLDTTLFQCTSFKLGCNR